MSIFDTLQIYERFGSGSIRETFQKGKQPDLRSTLKYLVTGTDDEDEARAFVLNSTPSTYRFRKRKDAAVNPLGNKLWEADVEYELPETEKDDEDDELAGAEFSFETSGGTTHITQSLHTEGRYKVADWDGDIPDYQGAIGVIRGERVEGCDIVVPVFNFSETHHFEVGDITRSYVISLARLTGTVNDSAFKGFAKGEVLFLGASGRAGDGEWTITYSFAASQNLSNLQIGEIQGIDKLGWEYLWVEYETAVDNAAGTIVQKPVFAFVEWVYHFGDLGDLGI